MFTLVPMKMTVTTLMRSPHLQLTKLLVDLPWAMRAVGPLLHAYHRLLNLPAVDRAVFLIARKVHLQRR